MKIKNENGEEIEVYTSAEVEERTKAAAEEAKGKALEEYKAQNPDKGEEVEKLKNILTETEKKLQEALDAGGDEKNPQIIRLRQERDEAKKNAESAVKGLEVKLEQFRKEYIGDAKTDWLNKLSNGNEDLKKKIEYHFDNYRSSAVTKKDIEERMTVAYQLATGNKPTPGFLDGKTSGGDRGLGGYAGAGATKELTPNQKAIGAVLGITDKDRENYKKFEAIMDQKRAAGLIPN